MDSCSSLVSEMFCGIRPVFAFSLSVSFAKEWEAVLDNDKTKSLVANFFFMV